jgi:hypothetical protein
MLLKPRFVAELAEKDEVFGCYISLHSARPACRPTALKEVNGKGALDWQLRRATPTRSIIGLLAKEVSRRARAINPLNFV